MNGTGSIERMYENSWLKHICLCENTSLLPLYPPIIDLHSLILSSLCWFFLVLLKEKICQIHRRHFGGHFGLNYWSIMSDNVSHSRTFQGRHTCFQCNVIHFCLALIFQVQKISENFNNILTRKPISFHCFSCFLLLLVFIIEITLYLMVLSCAVAHTHTHGDQIALVKQCNLSLSIVRAPWRRTALHCFSFFSFTFCLDWEYWHWQCEWFNFVIIISLALVSLSPYGFS